MSVDPSLIISTVALISQVVILVTTIVGFMSAAQKVRELHLMLNSRLDELVKFASRVRVQHIL